MREWLMPRLKQDPIDSHARDLMMCLMSNKDTQYQINVFESLRDKFYKELERKESEASQECAVVNTYLCKNDRKRT